MYKILEKTQVSELVFQFRVQAPRVAPKVKAGQFFIVQANETGERIPFTFSNWNAEEGWIEFIFMVVGKTTQLLSSFEAGDYLQDIVGPLGDPTRLTAERWVVVGGGVGIASAYPVARALCEQGADVSFIMGARTADLLILEKEVSALPLKHLVICTDDGSKGIKALVTQPLDELYEQGEFDKTFAVGPVPMMKYCSLVAKKHNAEISVCLNTIMVDGTGMCGACRCTVDGETRFACVDGPEFNGILVDWEQMSARARTYKKEEAKSVASYQLSMGEGQ